MTSARRSPHGDRQTPLVDPTQRDRAQSKLRAWAADNGRIIID
jgi:hypothetical protein